MGAHAVYDPVRDRMLLFGGRRWASDAQPLLDAFALTLSGTPTWSRLAGSGDAPAFPDGFTWAVSDPRRDRLLVGTYGSPRLHALDLGTSVWTSLATAAPPQPQHPIVRGGSIVLDTANDRLVCFGGLWEDGETRSFTNAVSDLRLGAAVPEWREVSTAGPLPAARAHHAAAYDAAGQRLLVYGGWWGTAYGDISQHADAQQLTLPASGTPVWSALPSAEAGGRMAQGAVAALGEMVVFGGAGTAGEAARADNLSLTYGTSRAFWRPCATRTPRTAR
jgi:hypothetical protein